MTNYNTGQGTSGITQSHLLDLNMNLILDANPYMANQPEALMRLANSGAHPLDMVNNAGAMAGVQNIEELATSLENLSPVAQRSVYGKLTEQQQRALNQVSYAPPEAEPEFKIFGVGMPDIVGDAVGLVGSIADPLMSPIKTVLGPPLGKALNALTWIGDVGQHFYRAIRQMEGWQQWLAAGAAVAGVAALPFAAPAFLAGAASLGTLATVGAYGAAGLGAATLATIPTAITNPTEWWDVMNPFGAQGIGKGERVFLRGSRNRAREILGKAEHLDALARDVAINMDLYDLAEDFAGVRDASSNQVYTESIARVAATMADEGTPEFQAIYDGLQQLANMPEFRAAVDELQTGKISIGRDAASVFGLQEGDWGHGFVSGSVDALTLLTLDPTLGLAKAGTLMRLGRRGLMASSADDVVKRLTDMVATDRAVAATVDQVSTAVALDQFELMPKAWRGLWNDLTEWRRGLELENGLKAEDFSRKEFMDYVQHGDGLKRLMEGKGTIAGIEQIIISNTNRSTGWGKFIDSARRMQEGFTDATYEQKLRRLAKDMGVEIDLDKWLPANIMDTPVDARFVVREAEDALETATAQMAYNAGATAGKVLRKVPGGTALGDFIGAISTMTPPGKAIDLVGEASVDDIPRFIETMGRHFNLPSAVRKEWLNTVMMQGTVGQRRQVLMSYMDSVFTAGGLRSTDELSSLADEFVMKYRQAYGLGGLDSFDIMDAQRIVGILPDMHQAVYMVTPNLREMSKIVRQGHILRYVTKLTDSNFVEASMSRFVKPGWLMRIGFIPRAAGEEMLAFALRATQGGLMQELGGRSVEMGAAFKAARKKLDDAAGDFSKLTDIEREALTYKVPSHMKPLVAMFARTGWKDPAEQLAERYGVFLRDHLKRGLGKDDWLELPDSIKALKGRDIDSLSRVEKAKLARSDAHYAMLFGRERSVRRGVVGGVDKKILRSANEWVVRHSDATMRATTSQNASRFEKNVVNPNTETIAVVSPKDPSKRVEIPVVLTGERTRVGKSAAGRHDLRYDVGLMHRLEENFQDEAVGRIWAEGLTQLFRQEQFTAVTKPMVVETLEAGRAVRTHTSRMIYSRLLEPRPDNLASLITYYEKSQPEVAAAIRAGMNAPEGPVEGIIGALADTAESLRIDAQRLAAQQVASGAPEAVLAQEIEALYEQAQQLQNIVTELDQSSAVFSTLADLPADERAYLGAMLSRDINNDGYDLDALRAWADGSAAKAPRRVLYRGVPNAENYYVRADGALVLRATTQDHLPPGTVGISTSVSPEQAMIYALGGVDSGIESNLLTGSLLEIDADVAVGSLNTTFDDAMTRATTYEEAPESLSDAGAYLMGKRGDDGPMTEVMLFSGRGNDSMEIVIPADKWRISDKDQMREFIANRGENRWQNALGRVAGDIEGLEVDDVVQDIDLLFEEYISGLSQEEYAALADLLRYDLEADEALEPMHAAFTSGANRLSVGDLGGISELVGTEGPGYEALNRLVELLNEEVAEGIKRFHVYKPLDEQMTSVGGFDDFLRTRLGLDVRPAEIKYGPGGVVTETKYRPNALDGLINTMRDRGAGGFVDEVVETAPPWSGMFEDVEEWRAWMESKIYNELLKPENQVLTKKTDRLLQGPNGEPTIQPPADGVARIYNPVVPADMARVSALLDAPPRVGTLQPEANQILEDLRTFADNAARSDAIQFDAMVSRLEGSLYSAEYRAKYQALVNKMRSYNPSAYDDMIAAGQAPFRIADVLDEFEELYTLTTRSEGWKGMARELLAGNNVTGWENEIIGLLTQDEQIDLVAKALRLIDSNRATYGQPVTVALAQMGFDDPRIARWISALLSDGVDDIAAAKVGMMEVPRKVMEGQGQSISGVRLSNYSEAYGRQWDLGDQWMHKSKPLDGRKVHQVASREDWVNPLTGKAQQTIDWAIGATYEESLTAYSKLIMEHMLTSARRGVNESQTVKNVEMGGKRIAQRVGNRYEAIPEGTRLDTEVDLYWINDEGKVEGAVNWGDPRYMDASITAQREDLMYGILGPMARDKFEGDAGYTVVVPRRFRESKNWRGKTKPAPLDEVQDVDQEVIMRHSRLDDIGNEEAADLPNVTLAETYKALDDTFWDRFVRYGFQNVIGPAIDSLARKPMTFHYFSIAHEQHMEYLDWMLDDSLFGAKFELEFGDMLAGIREGVKMSDDERTALTSIAQLLDYDVDGLDDLSLAQLAKDILDSEEWDNLPARLESMRKGAIARIGREIPELNQVSADTARTRLADQLAEFDYPFGFDNTPEALDRVAEIMNDARQSMGSVLDDNPDLLEWFNDYELRIQSYRDGSNIGDFVENENLDYMVEELRALSASKSLPDETIIDDGLTKLDQLLAVDLEFQRGIDLQYQLTQFPQRTMAVDVVGSGITGATDSRRLVTAYHEYVPDEVWARGKEAVTSFLDGNELGLASDFTAEQWRILKAARDNMKYALDTASETASLRAINNMIPFLDSHEQRSMFAEYARNFLPFWYAEENFIKRWGRGAMLGRFATPLGDVPSFGLDMVRKAQLAYMGIKSAGIVRTDTNGQDWVVYPGSGLLTEVVAKVLPGDVLPIGVLFQASTDSMLPGVNAEMGGASVSPFVAMPVHMLTHLFPDAKNMKRALLGDIGASRGVVSQFVPSIMQNAWTAAFENEDSSVKYASAMMAAMAFAEANDQGLPDEATPDQIDEYLDKMRNHARIIMTAQMLTGYVVPGAPVPIASGASGMDWLSGMGIDDPKQITSKLYREYIANMGVDEGTQAFLAAYPYADLEDVVNPMAFTASTSTSVSGAPLPATKTGLTWYNEHQRWIDASPEAGAWFLPPDDTDEKFDYYSYGQQLVSGLRKKKNPTEFLRSMKYRIGADVYFQMKDEYDNAVLQVADDPDRKRRVDDWWSSWKAQFMAANPIFAEELQDGTARRRRARTIEQMRYAVDDPAAPPSPHTEAIRELVKQFDEYMAVRRILADSNTAENREKLRKVKEWMTNWVTQWTIQNPSLERLWSSVYEPEARLD